MDLAVLAGVGGEGVADFLGRGVVGGGQIGEQDLDGVGGLAGGQGGMLFTLIGVMRLANGLT